MLDARFVKHPTTYLRLQHSTSSRQLPHNLRIIPRPQIRHTKPTIPTVSRSWLQCRHFLPQCINRLHLQHLYLPLTFHNRLRRLHIIRQFFYVLISPVRLYCTIDLLHLTVFVSNVVAAPQFLYANRCFFCTVVFYCGVFLLTVFFHFHLYCLQFCIAHFRFVFTAWGFT